DVLQTTLATASSWSVWHVVPRSCAKDRDRVRRPATTALPSALTPVASHVIESAAAARRTPGRYRDPLHAAKPLRRDREPRPPPAGPARSRPAAAPPPCPGGPPPRPGTASGVPRPWPSPVHSPPLLPTSSKAPRRRGALQDAIATISTPRKPSAGTGTAPGVP